MDIHKYLHYNFDIVPNFIWLHSREGRRFAAIFHSPGCIQLKTAILGYVFVTISPSLVKVPTERMSSLFSREPASTSTNPQTGRRRCSRYYFAFLLLPTSSLQGSHHGRCDSERPDIREALGPMLVRGMLHGSVSSSESLTAAEIRRGRSKAVAQPQ